MALIRPIQGTMSGKLGGQVFQKNGRVRSFFMPGNPKTSLQQAARAALVNAASLFAALTEVKADGWSAWAASMPRTNRVGSSYLMSAKAAYLSINVLRLKVGLTKLDDAPAVGQNTNMAPLPDQPDAAAEAGSATLTVTIGTSYAPAVGQKLAVFVGSPRSASSRRARKSLVLAGVIDGASTPPTTGTVTLPSGEAKLGDVYDVEYVLLDNEFANTWKAQGTVQTVEGT